MSRGLSANNAAEIAKAYLQPVALGQFNFDTPVYVHTGVGSITYDGNAYTGLGDFVGMSEMRESEALTPLSMTFTLSSDDAALEAEALDAGNFRDTIKVFIGYRGDDGLLVDDPWLGWSGFYDTASVRIDLEESVIKVVGQHDLATLNEKAGDRYSDEDAQDKNAGDVGLEYLADMRTTNLTWGRRPVVYGSGAGNPTGRTGPRQRP